MSGRGFLLLASAGLMATAAVVSASSGSFALGGDNLALSSNLTVDNWTLRTHDGQSLITDVTVSGVPESLVGRSITVYLQGSSNGHAAATVSHAGSVRIPVASPVPADGVDTVAVVVTG